MRRRIVPQQRLLVWAALVLVPGAALLTALPAAAGVGLSLITAFIGIAALDAAFGAGRLAGLRVELPGTTRLVQSRPGTIELRLTGEARRIADVRLCVSFPAGLETSAPCQSLRLLAGEARGLRWPLTGRERGRHRLSACHAETDSPLGLWAVRHTVAVSGEVRVYPNLFAQRETAALLVRRSTPGLQPHRRVGMGREFERLREYWPGDSFEEIHWKATARRARPITKMFQVERTQELYVVIDTSRLAGRATGEPPSPALDSYLRAAFLLAVAAQRQGDLFGMVAFSDRARVFVRARGGRAHFEACREALYALRPEEVNPDFGELASFLRQRVRRRAFLVVLTDLSEPVLGEGFLRALEILRRQHLVFATTLRRPGIGELFSGAAPSEEDGLYDRLAGHLSFRDLGELGREIERRGGGFALHDSAELAGGLVRRYAAVKERGLL